MEKALLVSIERTDILCHYLVFGRLGCKKVKLQPTHDQEVLF